MKLLISLRVIQQPDFMFDSSMFREAKATLDTSWQCVEIDSHSSNEVIQPIVSSLDEVTSCFLLIQPEGDYSIGAARKIIEKIISKPDSTIVLFAAHPILERMIKTSKGKVYLPPVPAPFFETACVF